MDPIADFTVVAATMSDLLAQIGPADLDRPTPCDGWDVQALVDHIVDNTAFFAGAAGVVADPRPPITAADAEAAFDAVAADVVAGFGAPGVLVGQMETPYGAFVGATVLAVAVADVATHCWDLGQALGVAVTVDPVVVDHAMAAWEAFIIDDYRANGMFGPAHDCPASATPLDCLAAYAGRPLDT